MLPFLMIISSQKNLRYPLIPSRDIDDQRLLQSDWTRGTTGYTQPKMIVRDATFALLFFCLIPARHIDDQRILQSDWLREFSGKTQEPLVWTKFCAFFTK